MIKITTVQRALIKQLIKAGPAGIVLSKSNERTVDALMRRGIAGVRAGRVVLTAPTKTIKVGIATRTVLDLPEDQA